MSTTFALMVTPYYDSFSQCYYNVITVNVEPAGPLKAFVRRINIGNMQKFPRKSNNSCIKSSGCSLVLGTMAGSGVINCSEYMTPEEIPMLFNYLTTHGYQIDTQLTNMMSENAVKIKSDEKLVCFSTYYGSNSPNFVYIK
jgi:hypothetical protein